MIENPIDARHKNIAPGFFAFLDQHDLVLWVRRTDPCAGSAITVWIKGAFLAKGAHRKFAEGRAHTLELAVLDCSRNVCGQVLALPTGLLECPKTFRVPSAELAEFLQHVERDLETWASFYREMRQRAYAIAELHAAGGDQAELKRQLTEACDLEYEELSNCELFGGLVEAYGLELDAMVPDDDLDDGQDSSPFAHGPELTHADLERATKDLDSAELRGLRQVVASPHSSDPSRPLIRWGSDPARAELNPTAGSLGTLVATGAPGPIPAESTVNHDPRDPPHD